MSQDSSRATAEPFAQNEPTPYVSALEAVRIAASRAQEAANQYQQQVASLLENSKQSGKSKQVPISPKSDFLKPARDEFHLSRPSVPTEPLGPSGQRAQLSTTSSPNASTASPLVLGVKDASLSGNARFEGKSDRKTEGSLRTRPNSVVSTLDAKGTDALDGQAAHSGADPDSSLPKAVPSSSLRSGRNSEPASGATVSGGSSHTQSGVAIEPNDMPRDIGRPEILSDDAEIERQQILGQFLKNRSAEDYKDKTSGTLFPNSNVHAINVSIFSFLWKLVCLEMKNYENRMARIDRMRTAKMVTIELMKRENYGNLSIRKDGHLSEKETAQIEKIKDAVPHLISKHVANKELDSQYDMSDSRTSNHPISPGREDAANPELPTDISVAAGKTETNVGSSQPASSGQNGVKVSSDERSSLFTPSDNKWGIPYKPISENVPVLSANPQPGRDVAAAGYTKPELRVADLHADQKPNIELDNAPATPPSIASVATPSHQVTTDSASARSSKSPQRKAFLASKPSLSRLPKPLEEYNGAPRNLLRAVANRSSPLRNLHNDSGAIHPARILPDSTGTPPSRANSKEPRGAIKVVASELKKLQGPKPKEDTFGMAYTMLPVKAPKTTNSRRRPATAHDPYLELRLAKAAIHSINGKIHTGHSTTPEPMTTESIIDPFHNPKRSLHSLLRNRGLGREYAGHRNIRTELQTRLGEGLLPWRYWKGASSDVVTTAWGPDSTLFAVGAATHSDHDSLQYNRPNNLLLGSLPSNTLEELPDHRVNRPSPGTIASGPNSTQATYDACDPMVYKTVSFVLFSACGSKLYSASEDETVKVWDVSSSRGSGKRLTASLPHNANVTSVETTKFHPRIFASARKSSTDPIRVYKQDGSHGYSWNSYVSTRAVQKPNFQLEPECMKFGTTYHTAHLLLAGFTQWGDISAFEISREGHLCLWDLNTRENIKVTPGSQSIMALAWQPMGIYFATGGSAPRIGLADRKNTKTVVRTWELRSPKRCNEYECSALDINDIAFHPLDANIITAGYTDGSTYVWDARRPDTIMHRLEHGKPLLDLDHNRTREQADTGVMLSLWGPGASLFYTGSSDGKIKAWDLSRHPTDVLVKDVAQLNAGVQSGSFSPDGSHLLVGDAEGGVHILSSAPVGEQPDLNILDDETGATMPIHYRPALSSNTLPEDDPENPGTEGIRSARALLDSGQLAFNPYFGVGQGPEYNGPYAQYDAQRVLSSRVFDTKMVAQQRGLMEERKENINGPSRSKGITLKPARVDSLLPSRPSIKRLLAGNRTMHRSEVESGPTHKPVVLDDPRRGTNLQPKQLTPNSRIAERPSIKHKIKNQEKLHKKKSNNGVAYKPIASNDDEGYIPKPPTGKRQCASSNVSNLINKKARITNRDIIDLTGDGIPNGATSTPTPTNSKPKRTHEIIDLTDHPSEGERRADFSGSFPKSLDGAAEQATKAPVKAEMRPHPQIANEAFKDLQGQTGRADEEPFPI